MQLEHQRLSIQLAERVTRGRGGRRRLLQRPAAHQNRRGLLRDTHAQSEDQAHPSGHSEQPELRTRHQARHDGHDQKGVDHLRRDLPTQIKVPERPGRSGRRAEEGSTLDSERQAV